jgi:hypothetical protein
MRHLTPSVASACVELVGVIARNSPTAPELDSLRILSVSGEDLLAFARYLRWVELRETGHLALTADGIAASAIDDPRAAIRALLAAYIDIAKPAWVQTASAGRRELLSHAPPGVQQVFAESGMAYGYDDDVVAWWDSLATRARRVRDDALTEIGRQGERRSLEYERNRTGRDPKWTAVESNLEGYDILSTLSADDARRLTIEVKTSQQSAGSAWFFLSRNEWEHAVAALHHAFHLWTLNGDAPRLAVLSVDDVAAHLPNDAGDGAWQTARVPFRAFEAAFTEPTTRA